jgi:DNA-binding response OmpR family regulator
MRHGRVASLPAARYLEAAIREVQMTTVKFSLPKTVLVADDDADTRTIVEATVLALGCTPKLAASGSEAIALLQQGLPDLAILDIMMPGPDGLQVCERLKRQAGGEVVPVLMLTARDSMEDKVAALEEGADDYLTKPFHYQELQARIHALLRVRELNLQLKAKHDQLVATQQRLVERERELVAHQLAGTAAHSLGQPLSAIILNCHLLEALGPEDPKYQTALGAIRVDTQRMAQMLEQLKEVDPRQTRKYCDGVEILDLEGKKR